MIVTKPVRDRKTSARYDFFLFDDKERKRKNKTSIRPPGRLKSSKF